MTVVPRTRTADRPPGGGRVPPGGRGAARRAPRPPVDRYARGRTVLGLAALGAVATLAFWWWTTGLDSVDTPGGALLAAGRVLGLLGGYLLLVEVALMARIPWLERELGSSWLTVVHRFTGTALVLLLVAHAVVLVVGYSIGDRAPVVAEAVWVVRTYPYVLMATVALGLLVAVAVISAGVVRRRLAYETWHYLHLYAYLGVALGFAHQVVIGADFTQNDAARWVWTAVHLAVGAAVLVFRVGLPLRTSLRHRMRVAAVVPEGPDTVSVHITGRNLRRLKAQPGQYFRWRFLTRENWWQAHPFSLSAPPDAHHLRFTAKELGDHSANLRHLRPGTRVLVEGPYGNNTAARRTRRGVLLLAGGVGITPLRALFQSLPGDVVLAYRANSFDDLIFGRELQELAEARRSPVHLLLGPRGGPGRPDPMSAAELRARVPDLARRDVYVCGPSGMVQAARRELRAAGVPRRRVHVEDFDF